MKKVQIMTLAAALMLLGCKGIQKEKKQDKSSDTKMTAINEHSAEMALDWNGTYKGLLPCASCPGILTTIKLNKDKSFEQTDYYLETKEACFKSSGTFTFSKDGNKITLTSKDNAITMYAVGENKLIMLDKNGKENTSEIAEMYKLSKMTDEDVKFTKEPVKGILVLGHEVSSFNPCGSSLVYWINDTPNGKLNKSYNSVVGKNASPYTPVMAELVVTVKGEAQEGFAEQYDGVLETVSIKHMATITPDNYCK